MPTYSCIIIAVKALTLNSMRIMVKINFFALNARMSLGVHCFWEVLRNKVMTRSY